MNYLLKGSLLLIIFILSLMYILQHDVHVSSRQKAQNKARIPSIVHFIVGQTDQQHTKHRFALTTPFSFIHYLTFLAARRHVRPEKLFVHFYEEPTTFWWNLTKHDTEINATLIKTRLVESIFEHPVYHHSHRSDVLRLEILIKYGGIYLDIDILSLRSFEPLLNLSDVIMGFENTVHKHVGSAVILSKKNAMFLRRIYDGYQSYDHNCWVCHAIILPGTLANIYPKEVKILSPNAFFLPGYMEKAALFQLNDYNFTSNYACHLWNKMNDDSLKTLTPSIILNGNFTLARMLREAIGNETLYKLKKYFRGNSTN